MTQVEPSALIAELKALRGHRGVQDSNQVSGARLLAAQLGALDDAGVVAASRFRESLADRIAGLDERDQLVLAAELNVPGYPDVSGPTLDRRRKNYACKEGVTTKTAERRGLAAFSELAMRLAEDPSSTRRDAREAGLNSRLAEAEAAEMGWGPDLSLAAEQDPWLRWLGLDRFHGMSESAIADQVEVLRKIRRRVIESARIKPDQRVLDLGAGLEFMSAGIVPLLGEAGVAIPLDSSHAALRYSSQHSTGTRMRMAGRAENLPIASGSLDCVVVRSTLMFLVESERTEAVGEIFRVLRTGGRFSLFEPVPSYETLARWDFGTKLGRHQADHERVIALVRERCEVPDKAIMSFNERDLAEEFTRAGFQEVNAAFEYRHDRAAMFAESSVQRMLHVPPNPLVRSYAWCAQEVLGDASSRHLEAVAACLRRTPIQRDSAALYMWGTA